MMYVLCATNVLTQNTWLRSEVMLLVKYWKRLSALERKTKLNFQYLTKSTFQGIEENKLPGLKVILALRFLQKQQSQLYEGGP